MSNMERKKYKVVIYDGKSQGKSKEFLSEGDTFAIRTALEFVALHTWQNSNWDLKDISDPDKVRLVTEVRDELPYPFESLAQEIKHHTKDYHGICTVAVDVPSGQRGDRMLNVIADKLAAFGLQTRTIKNGNESGESKEYHARGIKDKAMYVLITKSLAGDTGSYVHFPLMRDSQFIFLLNQKDYCLIKSRTSMCNADVIAMDVVDNLRPFLHVPVKIGVVVGNIKKVQRTHSVDVSYLARRIEELTFCKTNVKTPIDFHHNPELTKPIDVFDVKVMMDINQDQEFYFLHNFMKTYDVVINYSDDTGTKLVRSVDTQFFPNNTVNSCRVPADPMAQTDFISPSIAS